MNAMFNPLLAAEPAERAAACVDHASNLCKWTYNITSNDTVSGYVDDFAPLLRILIILAVGWIVQRMVRRVIKRIVQGLQADRVQRGLSTLRRRTPKALLNTSETATVRRAQRAETLGAILRSTSTVIIGLITFFACVRALNLNLAPFIAGTAIATAALGFGAQNIVRDFLAGFFIVVEDQYGVGDVIDTGKTPTGVSGVVEGVSLRTTRVRSSDGTLWHIPNGSMQGVGNKSQTWSRALVEFRVTLDTDISHAIDVMNRVAEELCRDSAYAGLVTSEPEIWAPDAIDTDGILLKVLIKTRPMEQWRVSRTLRSRIKSAFDAEGIRIASMLPEKVKHDDEGFPEA
jgi:small-conductance mechanosensitive channel